MLEAFLDFSWNGEVGAGDALVGAGTLALAWFTWRLARQTKADVDASRDSIAVSREAIEAADMPFVIPTPVPTSSPFSIRKDGPATISFEQAGSTHWLNLRLWNLGKGPAIVRDILLDLEDAQVLYGLRNAIPIATEQAHDLNVEMRYAFVATDYERRGTLTVIYSHASGTHHQTECSVVIAGRIVTCESFNRSQATSDSLRRSLDLTIESRTREDAAVQ